MKLGNYCISAATWSDTFDLPDGSYSMAYIQDYFKFIIKKHETLTGNPLVEIYPNKTKNRIALKIKNGEDKNGEDVPKLESVKVVLVHCNLVNNNYQQASKVLFTFVPNKQFGQLINIAPHSLTI